MAYLEAYDDNSEPEYVVRMSVGSVM